MSAALVTADFQAAGVGSQITVTVQLSSIAQDMANGYRLGFGVGLANLSDLVALDDPEAQDQAAGLRRLMRLVQLRHAAAMMGARRLFLQDPPDRPAHGG